MIGLEAGKLPLFLIIIYHVKNEETFSFDLIEHNPEKMNNLISWDPSLVKKYGSSNHFKLLNQLRSEVKKYPLTKKKNISLNTVKSNADDIKTNTIIPKAINQFSAKNDLPNDVNNNKQSTISFNNSKNFSIYNNANTPLNSNENKLLVDKQSIEDISTTSTFNERLNQIDMK